MHVFALGPLDLHTAEPVTELERSAPRSDAVAVRLRRGTTRVWAEPPPGALRLGSPAEVADVLHVAIESSGVRLWLPDEAVVHIRGLGPAARRLEVEVHPVPGLPAPTLRHLILDQVLPRIAFHLGGCVLHAGGAVLEGRAVVVLGASGAGKSSLVAACLQAGAQVLGDDTLLLDVASPETVVRTWYPGLRIGEASRVALLPDVPRGDALREPDGKHRLEVPRGAWATEALLGCILLPEVASGARLSLVRVSTKEAVGLLAASMLRLLPNDVSRATLELDQLARLLTRHPVWRLALPDDLRALPQAVALVRRQLGAAGRVG